jgi:hypothetical protein
MKVAAIDKRTSKKGKDYWVTALEGDDRPLLLWNQPNYKEGDDIPETQLQLKTRDDGTSYWSMAEQRSGKPKSQRSPEERESIVRQSAGYQATQIYCSSVGSPAPWDDEKWDEIYSHIYGKLNPSYLVDAAKKQGAKDA